MSYNAVTALLARVCQYAGLEQEAFDYADEVVKAHGGVSGWFKESDV